MWNKAHTQKSRWKDLHSCAIGDSFSSHPNTSVSSHCTLDQGPVEAFIGNYKLIGPKA